MARILLIEDNDAFREMLVRALSSAGHDVIAAHDGDDGLRCFQTQGPFALVITDIVMPNREGIGTILELLQHGDVPIIAMSGGGKSVGTRDALEAARMLGAAETMTKPFPLRDLLGAVTRLAA
ncbi:MAG: response regulator [Gemmatimonadaceae bacterium]|jgi:DNA-binding response OmpR family regulator|nr:response regulator [Gemmatimonadaceae bacterium]